MRALVVYCHPSPGRFTAAVRDAVLDRLAQAGAEVRLHDLYAGDFRPVLTRAEWEGYQNCPANRAAVATEVADLQWCDTLIFVYPTWWYGLPAMLKGWLERVMLPDVAFIMPATAKATIRPGLTQVTRLGVFTTCGASWWLTRLVGAPGRRTILRGLRLICAPRCRTVFAAHYLMDSSTPASRTRHLARVRHKADRFLGSAMPHAATERAAE